jgi:hypothetical protein
MTLDQRPPQCLAWEKDKAFLLGGTTHSFKVPIELPPYWGGPHLCVGRFSFLFDLAPSQFSLWRLCFLYVLWSIEYSYHFDLFSFGIEKGKKIDGLKSDDLRDAKAGRPPLRWFLFTGHSLTGYPRVLLTGAGARLDSFRARILRWGRISRYLAH